MPDQIRVACVQMTSRAGTRRRTSSAPRRSSRARRRPAPTSSSCRRSGTRSADADDFRATAEPLDGGESVAGDVGLGAHARRHARRRLDHGAARRAREALEHELRLRPRRRARRRLPEDPSVRRRGRRRTSTASPRPRSRAPSPSSRTSRAGRRADRLLRRPLPGALPDPRARRRGARHRPRALHDADGKDHWHVLLRARAIENQLYVAAAGQVGETLAGKPAYGRSLIADPWGIGARAGARRGDRDRRPSSTACGCATSATKLPSLANRRPDAYRWPTSSSTRWRA